MGDRLADLIGHHQHLKDGQASMVTDLHALVAAHGIIKGVTGEVLQSQLGPPIREQQSFQAGLSRRFQVSGYRGLSQGSQLVGEGGGRSLVGLGGVVGFPHPSEQEEDNG